MNSDQVPRKVDSQERGIQAFDINRVADYMVFFHLNNGTESLPIHYEVVGHSSGVGGSEYELLLPSTDVPGPMRKNKRNSH